MNAPGFDHDDEFELADMHAQLRDHMVADHILRATTPEEQTQLISGFLAQNRALAHTLHNYAVVLRHFPDAAAEIPGQLDEIAEMLARQSGEPEES